MLLQLEDIIAQKKNWREDVLTRFTQQPFDLTNLYPPEFNPWYLEEPLTLDEELSDPPTSNEELSDEAF